MPNANRLALFVVLLLLILTAGFFLNKNKSQTESSVVDGDVNNLPQAYVDSTNHFILRYPTGYTVDDAYTYDLLGPDRSISGVKFTIPATLALSTNLGQDTYISVENIAGPSCSPRDFLAMGQGTKVSVVEEDGLTYSVASTTGAGAGNRYEEHVYVVEGADPCLAVRYFIHYTVFENYPAGAVTRFDESALLGQFDAIRHSLTLNT